MSYPAAGVDDTTLFLLRDAAALLDEDDGDVLRAMLRRLERGAPPLATEAERDVIRRGALRLHMTMPPGELRAKAMAWLAKRCGVQT